MTKTSAIKRRGNKTSDLLENIVSRRNSCRLAIACEHAFTGRAEHRGCARLFALSVKVLQPGRRAYVCVCVCTANQVGNSGDADLPFRSLSSSSRFGEHSFYFLVSSGDLPAKMGCKRKNTAAPGLRTRRNQIQADLLDLNQ